MEKGEGRRSQGNCLFEDKESNKREPNQSYKERMKEQIW